MRKVILLESGSREEACSIFDAAKRGITDFKKESISMHGNIRNDKEGWSVVKTHF